MNAPVKLASPSRQATAADLPGISALHARVFGPGRFVRSAYRVREGKSMVSRFCRVVESGGRIVAGVHVTEITIGGVGEAALLGPIAVDADLRSVGYGKMLIAEAIDALKRGGVRVVILVGDEPYYGRFGFKPAPRGQIVFPGPVNPDRLLALELAAGALADYCGLVVASPQPR